ncbi:MAG: hypothetical protein JWO15_3828 [Sphingomonadales bacterium]|nr:hypothetical protein [Sphingomonadales bacterium]
MVPSTPHVVIYSHGFGVRKTDRGLFTAIARALPDAESVMFDYNPVNEESNTLTVKPLHEQALKLRKVINTVRAEYSGAIIDLVCHSEGCVVAGLVKPRGLRKVIMITPPTDISEASKVERLATRKGINIDVNTRTRLPRSDGSTTVIHPEYWQSLAGIDPIKLYNRLSRFTALRIINARQDEVLGEVSFEGIDPAISLVTLDGNHNFDDEEARNRILYILQKELATA